MRSSRLSEINYCTWKISVEPTSTELFHCTPLYSVSNTMYSGTSLQGCCPSKNSLKSDRGRTRKSGELLPVELDKRLSLGKDEEKREFRLAALFSLINVVLIIGPKYPHNSENITPSIKSPTELHRGLISCSGSVPQLCAEGLRGSHSRPLPCAEVTAGTNFHYLISKIF